MIREILWVHVGAGILSLLLGLGVFILRKGDSIHVRAGKLYALMMFIIFDKQIMNVDFLTPVIDGLSHTILGTIAIRNFSKPFRN